MKFELNSIHKNYTDILYSSDMIRLHLAAEGNNIKDIELLLDEGVNIDITDPWYGMTPLHIATKYNSKEAIKILLERGATVNVRDKDRKTPLDHAAENNNLEAIELLFYCGAEVNSEDDYIYTPLAFPSYATNREVIKLLLSQGGINLDEINRNRRITLSLLAESFYLRALDGLLGKNTHEPIVCNHNKTSLHYAAEKNSIESIKMLLGKNAKINAKARDGMTPLHSASSRGYIEVIRLLINYGADINAIDNEGMTSLHYATQEGYLEVIKLLVSKGANINVIDNYDFTPLYRAVICEKENIVKLLVLNGAALTTEIKEYVFDNISESLCEDLEKLSIEYKNFRSAYQAFTNLLAFMPIISLHNSCNEKHLMSKISYYITTDEVSIRANYEIAQALLLIYDNRQAARGVSKIKEIIADGTKINIQTIIKHDKPKTYAEKYAVDLTNKEISR